MGGAVSVKYIKKQTTLAVFVFSLALILTVSLVMLVQAAVPWTKSGTFSLTDGHGNNELFVEDAHVIKNSATDYQMWYTNGKTTLTLGDITSSVAAIVTDDIVNDLAALDLNALLADFSELYDAARDALYTYLSQPTTVIGYATSTDGLTWTVVNPEVLAGSSGGAWDSVGAPTVIKNSATDYEMWYSHTTTKITSDELSTMLDNLGGAPAARKDAIQTLIDATSSVIGYATSTDGIAWTEFHGVLTGSTGGLRDSVGGPSVIKNSATDYEMWYTQTETSITEAELDNILADIDDYDLNTGDPLAGGALVGELINVLNATSSVIGYATSPDGKTWTVVNPEVLFGSRGGVWDSVGGPSVIKNGSTYEMWYTQATTDLTTATDMQVLADALEALAPDIKDTWASIKAKNLIQFMLDVTDLIDNNANMDEVKELLAHTNTVIGYATSSDGIAWTVRNSQALVGTNSNLWASVANPSVVLQNGLYQIWFAQGIDELSAQNFLDTLQGDTASLGYASYPVGIDLVADWNFIGLPITPASTTIGDVLAGIIGDVELVWAFDSATDTWSYYIPGGAATLTDMTVGKGYWVKMSSPNTLTVAGTEPPLPYDIPLLADWNLISLPETPSSSTIGDVLAGIIGDVELVWAFDSATDTWSYYLPGGAATITDMTEGNAYWIKMTNPGTLTIN